MRISLLFFTILSGVAVSQMVFLPAIPWRSIGRGFFRLTIFLSLLLLLPFLPFNPYLSLPPTGLLQSAFGFYVLFAVAMLVLLLALSARKAGDVHPLIPGLTIGFGLGGLIFDSLVVLPARPFLWWEYLLVTLQSVSAAALLGSALFAMLLGHWYLVQFDLDKKLLRKVAAFYVVAMIARIAVIGISLVVYWKASTLGQEAIPSLVSLAGHGIFFWMRVGVGLVLPAVLAYMIWETACLGANQACTGLLYIAVILVFMGEMVSRYLFFLKGLPL